MPESPGSRLSQSGSTGTVLFPPPPSPPSRRFGVEPNTYSYPTISSFFRYRLPLIPLTFYSPGLIKDGSPPLWIRKDSVGGDQCECSQSRSFR